MKYRNVRNGSVIDIPQILIDKDWEPIAPSPETKSGNKSAREPKNKKAVK